MKKFNCILLVDDDSINNFLHEMLLTKLSISEKVATVYDGQEALEYIKDFCSCSGDNCPNLIFLDINMPVMDGFEFLTAYKALNLNKDGIQVVVLSSSTDGNDIKKVNELGVKDFIIKPLTEDKINSYISAIN